MRWTDSCATYLGIQNALVDNAPLQAVWQQNPESRHHAIEILGGRLKSRDALRERSFIFQVLHDEVQR